MKITIIKYNAGNIQSVLFALKRLGHEGVVSDDPAVISTSDKVIFPGVGEASTAMNYLRERKLDETILQLKQPVLGICLGMQLLCTRSSENDTRCLGIFDADIRRFPSTLKVPQIGWNRISQLKGRLFNGVPEGGYAYFVHSYFAEPCRQTISLTEYAGSFSSGLQRDNFFGVQFHPEKSANLGERILKNFLEL